MSKKDFIALADALRAYGRNYGSAADFLELCRQMADFCHQQNPRFMRDRWLGYIAGECGPNGGRVK